MSTDILDRISASLDRIEQRLDGIEKRLDDMTGASSQQWSSAA